MYLLKAAEELLQTSAVQVPVTESHDGFLTYVFPQQTYNRTHAVPLLLTVNKCVAFQSTDKPRDVSHPPTHQIHSFF